MKYTPLLNPSYDPAKEARPRSFVDLRRQILGEKLAIRSAASDPRMAAFAKLNAESAGPQNAPAQVQPKRDPIP